MEEEEADDDDDDDDDEDKAEEGAGSIAVACAEPVSAAVSEARAADLDLVEEDDGAEDDHTIRAPRPLDSRTTRRRARSDGFTR